MMNAGNFEHAQKAFLDKKGNVGLSVADMKCSPSLGQPELEFYGIKAQAACVLMSHS